jgi:hypothetical protein
MSMGPLSGLAASVAGSPLAQTKGSEVERNQHAVGSHERRVQSIARAESAAGIGEADGENHETAERDADGRRLWEEMPGRPAGESGPEPPDLQSKDATGQSGNLLDLSG